MDQYESSEWGNVTRYTESLELNLGGGTHWLEPWAVYLLREFFRAEEDERLERWRWPENPDYVVYPPREEGDGVHWSVNERTGESHMNTRAGLQSDEHARAAAAYFDAHPEPSYTTAEWVAKAMYEDGQDGRAWEGVEPNEKPAWLALAEAAIAKYEEIR